MSTLSAAVGANQPNRSSDVLLVQRLLNNLIKDAGAVPLRPIPESGVYDDATEYAIHAVEFRYFYGVADALHRVEPDGDLFQFLVTFSEESLLLYKGPALSREVYGLAAKMVPAGADHILKKMMTEPKGHKKTIHRITVPGTIREHLPNILRALTSKQLDDADMIMMALATIRAETAGFRPIDEGQSKYNTSPKGTRGRHPFDLYDDNEQLGNVGAPDGATFKGRGFVQLTGRDNYTEVGGQIGVDLVNHPAQANDSETAARILAQFLKRRESEIGTALKKGDLKHARRLVNGGLHGFAEFKAAFADGREYLHLAAIQEAKRKVHHAPRKTKIATKVSAPGGAKH